MSEKQSVSRLNGAVLSTVIRLENTAERADFEVSVGGRQGAKESEVLLTVALGRDPALEIRLSPSVALRLAAWISKTAAQCASEDERGSRRFHQIPSDSATLDSHELTERVRPADSIPLAIQAIHDPVVTITGPTGVGKTALAFAIMRAIPGSAMLAYYDFRYGWTDPDDRESPAWTAQHVATLVIDDAGSGFDTDPGALERISQAIVERKRRGQQTIICTLLDRTEFTRRLGVAAATVAFGGTMIALDPSYRWNAPR